MVKKAVKQRRRHTTKESVKATTKRKAKHCGLCPGKPLYPRPATHDPQCHKGKKDWKDCGGGVDKCMLCRKAPVKGKW